MDTRDDPTRRLGPPTAQSGRVAQAGQRFSPRTNTAGVADRQAQERDRCVVPIGRPIPDVEYERAKLAAENDAPAEDTTQGQQDPSADS